MLARITIYGAPALRKPTMRDFPPPQIEDARHADFLAVAALDRIAWLHTGEPFIADGEHVWRVWCEYATVLVAREAAREVEAWLGECGNVAGALVMFPTSRGELFLHKIMVHPQRRGGGVGTGLMQAALARASAPVLLTVDPANTAAVELYRRFGFEVRERIKGYYRPHEHRYVMAYLPTKKP
jgi:ribosomal protein S18 acetylase RimI-like enzyme